MGFVADHPDAPLWMHIASSVGVVVFSILMAYALLKMYDEPVRAWLRDHWLQGEQRLPRWVLVSGGVLGVAALVVGLMNTI